jgi:deoxycytidylate deaminase
MGYRPGFEQLDIKKMEVLKHNIQRHGIVLSQHAEETVLHNYEKRKFLHKKIPIRKLHLIVIRVNSFEDLCESKPCQNCLRLLQQYGIRKVTYSTANGLLITENIATMESTPSVGYRSAERIIDLLNELTVGIG